MLYEVTSFYYKIYLTVDYRVWAVEHGLDLRSLAPTDCCNCLQRVKKLSRCASCQSSYYCSRACQEQHWQIHRCSNIPQELRKDLRLFTKAILVFRQWLVSQYRQVRTWALCCTARKGRDLCGDGVVRVQFAGTCHLFRHMESEERFHHTGLPFPDCSLYDPCYSYLSAKDSDRARIILAQQGHDNATQFVVIFSIQDFSSAWVLPLCSVQEAVSVAKRERCFLGFIEDAGEV